MRQATISLYVLLLCGVSSTVYGQPPEPAPQTQSNPDGLEIEVAENNPWTHLKFSGSAEKLRFAVVSPGNGKLAQTVDRLNLLQPDFVLSVGNQLEEPVESADEWNQQWVKFESQLAPLQMPFFLCAGPRDLPNAQLIGNWQQKFGRSYYSFRYQEVLFLVLNTEDLPAEGQPYQIGTAQQRWAIEQLNNNRDARWTFVIMHQPTWTFTKKEDHPGKLGWESIEDALQTRSYTVIAGHAGEYARYERKGREYYHLGEQGADVNSADELDSGRLDHLLWVTMTEQGPVVANLRLDGILPQDLRTLPDPKREK